MSVLNFPKIRTIRYKLIAGIVLPLFAVYCLLTTTVLWFDLSTALKHTRQSMIETTLLDAMTCEKNFSNAAVYAEGLARYISIHRPDSQESITLHIQGLLKDYPCIIGSGVSYEPGIFSERSGFFSPYMYRNANDPEKIIYKDLSEHNCSTEEWYKKMKKSGRSCWSEPYFDKNGAGVVMCTYAVPIFFEGKFAGTAFIDITLETINEGIRSIVAHNKSGVLFSASGKIIAASQHEWDMKETIYSIADKFQSDAFRRAGEEIADIHLNYYRFINPLNGEHSVLVCVPLQDPGWGLMVWQSEDAVSRPIYQRVFIRFAAFLLMLVFIVGLITVVARKITQPLGELVRFALELADGNLDAKIRCVNTNDEITQLAEVFTFMEVSLKKSIEETIQVRVAAAEAQNKAKTEFLTLVSHELRTPINGIFSAADLLLKTPLDAKQHELVYITEESSLLLLLLISNILDYSKLDVEGITTQNAIFNLHKLIEQIRPLTLFKAKNRNVHIHIHFDDRIKKNVDGDAVRLRQVLLNLLSNAVKFSAKENQSGNVTLNIKQSGHVENDSDTKIRFEVIDDGIGISEEKQKKIFETWQSNSSNNRRYDGFGLGLIVSKAIIDALNGTIGMYSEQGKGSTFWFEVPFAYAESKSSIIVPFVNTEKPAPKTLKILIAEDNKINQIVMQQMLKNLGCETAVAVNGQKAVEAWEDGDFDVILMDCQMPEMDGYEAAQVIRAKEKEASKKPVPIFALTANTSPGDKERCLAAGMNAYFNKPITADELVAAVKFWIAENAKPAGNPR